MDYERLRVLDSSHGGGGALKGYLSAVPFGMLLGVAIYMLTPLLNPPVATIPATATAIREEAVMAEIVKEKTPQLTASPTAKIAAEPTAVPRTAAPGCVFWEAVSVQEVGKELCVQGEYQDTYQREDGTYVMVFSEAQGSFQIWSTGKPFEHHLEEIGGSSAGSCVLVRGWVMTSGVRPMIVLGKRDKLEACP